MAALVGWAGAAFVSSAPVVWQQDGWRLLAGAAVFAAATLYVLSHLAGWRASIRFLAAAFAISWLAEAIGLHVPWLFGGTYRYHPGVRPLLPGGVPLFIPMSWYVLAGIAVILLRGFAIRRADGRRDWRRIALKSACLAWGVAACDLALDPVAVALGLWSWDSPGPYYGVPWLNFAGWGGVAGALGLLGYGWAGLDPGEQCWTPILFDLAWSASNGMLLLLLAVAADQRLGTGWPLVWCLVALSPLLVFWHWGVYRKFRRWGAARPEPARGAPQT